MLDFLISVLKMIIANLIVRFILFKDKKKWLKEPLNKYRADRGFYFIYKFIYSPVLLIGFALFGILVSLFDPNYSTLPRFTAAWIMFGVGLSLTIVLTQINKNYSRPVRPV